MLNMCNFQKWILIILIMFPATSYSALLDADVDVEIDLGNKTKIWAEGMLQKVEALAGKKLAEIDDLMRNHEENIFEKIAELSTDIKTHSICVEEKVNQDVHSLFSRFSDSGVLGWLIGPKEKYKQCGNYLDIKVANNALIREAGVCIYDHAVNDKKTFSSPTTMHALSEDLSNVFFSTWCSNVYKSGFKGSTDIFLKQHSSYAEISIGWHKIKNIKNSECRGTGNIKTCLKEFITFAKKVVDESHELDIRNAKKLLEDLEKKIVNESSNTVINNYIGDVQYILYFINKNKLERQKMVETKLKILLDELKKLEINVTEISKKYIRGNILCDADQYRQVNLLFGTGTANPLVVTRNKISGIIKSFEPKILELKPYIDEKNKDLFEQVKAFETKYTSKEKLWKLNNVRHTGGQCFVDFFCGRRSNSCNDEGVPY